MGHAFQTMTSDDPDENTVALNHAPRAIDDPCREFRQFRVFPAGRDAFVIGNPIGFPGRTFCEIIWANWCLAVAALPMLVQSGKFGFEILSFLKSSAQAILGRREPQHRHVGKMEQRRGGRRAAGTGSGRASRWETRHGGTPLRCHVCGFYLSIARRRPHSACRNINALGCSSPSQIGVFLANMTMPSPAFTSNKHQVKIRRPAAALPPNRTPRRCGLLTEKVKGFDRDVRPHGDRQTVAIRPHGGIDFACVLITLRKG